MLVARMTRSESYAEFCLASMAVISTPWTSYPVHTCISESRLRIPVAVLFLDLTWKSLKPRQSEHTYVQPISSSTLDNDISVPWLP